VWAFQALLLTVFLRTLGLGLGAGLAGTVYEDRIYRVGQNRIYTPYDRMYGDFPAKNTVYTPYIRMVLANPIQISA